VLVKLKRNNHLQLKIKILVCLLCLASSYVAIAQTNSVLATGDWYKFSVSSDGVFRISYDGLKKAGINPDQIDPRNIRIYAGSNSMLPQANNKPRVQDLVELAILVSGEVDGKFNTADFILFYGQGPDRYSYNTQNQIFEYENNLFTDKNFYFLTINTAGKRIGTGENIAGSFPLVEEFDDFGFYENEKYSILKSGRQWFGEQFDNTTEAAIRFDIPGIIANSAVKLTSQVMAQSISSCSFKVLFNNNPVLDQPIPAIENSTYATKGMVKTSTISLNSTTIKASNQSAQEVKFQFTKGTTPGISVGYLDFLLFAVKRNLAQYGDQTIFVSSKSLSSSTSSFSISSATAKSSLWEVTDPFSPTMQAATLNGDKLNFSTSTASLKKFAIFNTDKVNEPIFENKVANQNLHGTTAPQLIIISHPLFLKEAQRLAQHRQTKTGVTTKVVSTDEVFNEYSSGKQDFTSIRDFVRDLYKKSGSTLKNVLLFGRGSYDYKDRVFNNTNFVPIYESVNSLSPLETYSSDDFYGLLDDNEGDWNESPAANSTMDVGVGRIPIKTIDEAKAVVDKLIAYDTDPRAAGAWRKNFLFVADDGDYNLHQGYADQLANSVEVTNPEFDSKKLFLDSFDQIQRNTGPYSPDAAKALDLDIRKGYAIVNYTGHGSEKLWMQEQVLTETIVLNWKNSPYLPLFVTATCEFGRQDDPFIISSGERILLQPKGGGIGLVTTGRPVYSNTNFELNKAFYVSLFTKENNKFRDLGSIFRDTKNTSLVGVGNRNFSLLGDPSMRLALGNNQVIADEIKTSTNSTTLKAQSTVSVKGQIKNGGTKMTGFTGELTAILYDHPSNLTTKGTESEPFVYSQWSTILFQGKASVNQGDFQIDFVMPKNISSLVDKGKLSLYANATSGEGAIGSSVDFFIGGQEPNVPIDTTPPQIKLFLGDTTFRIGGTVGPNTKLVAHLSDVNGINVSSYNPANNIVATIDGKQSYTLNEYYISDKDNFTRGSLTFPVDTLKKGKHTFSLTASDNFNNVGTSSVDFIVSDGNGIVIEQLLNYPNPVVSTTKFQFTHSRPGEDLEASLVIYNLAGQVVLSQEYSLPESQYQVTLPEWNVEGTDGRKLSHGLYLAKLFVRSLVDGSNNEKNAKFILMN
jgi:Peptidase family C25